MKVSRVIVIVVALHVLVIGGIFVFEGCSRTRVQSPQLTENESTPDLMAGTDPVAGQPGGDPLQPMLPDVPPLPYPHQEPPSTDPQRFAELPAPAPLPASTTYTVKRGDSLWKISRNEGITVAELARANHIGEKSLLQIGQVLTIPAKSTDVALASALASAPVPSAATFDSSSIPAPAAAVYTVKRGDSLWKIAKANGTTVAALQQANSLNSTMLQIGQQLQLPAPTSSALGSSAAPTPAPAVRASIGGTGYNSQWYEPGRMINENGQQYHVVDWNESLGAVAQKHGVTLQQLKQANNLNNVQVHPGQRLLIPSPADVTQATPVLETSQAFIE